MCGHEKPRHTDLANRTPNSYGASMRKTLVAIGLMTILGQVVLLRELNVAFYGSELIYILAMGAWLMGTGLGAMWGRGLAQHLRLSIALFGALLPVQMVLVRCSRSILSDLPGAYLPFGSQLAVMAVVIAPHAFLAGLMFQWAARSHIGRGRTLAVAYALESAGGLLGGLLATSLLALGVQNLSAGLSCSLLALGVSLALGPGKRHPTWRHVLGGVLALLVPILAGGQLDRSLTELSHPHLFTSKDSPYGRLTVTRNLGMVSAFVNDALAFESQGTSAEEFVHLAAVQVGQARKVAILGGAGEGLVLQVIRHFAYRKRLGQPVNIDYFELDASMLDLVTRRLSQEISDSLADPSVRVHLGDPRTLLEGETAGDYDLLLLGMPEPDSGQAARYYTAEFFQICARVMSPEAVLALRLRSSENLWTPTLTQRSASIFKAMEESFSDVLILPGTVDIFLASGRGLIRDPGELATRWNEREVSAALVSAPFIQYVYTNDRVDQVRQLVAAAEAPVNSDSRPVCYQYTLLLWLSRFFPRLAMKDLTFKGSLLQDYLWWGLASAPLLLLLSFGMGRRTRARRVALVLLAGFAGMVAESILVLHYQLKSGVLYRDLGLLLTMFMTGLTLGAFLVDRIQSDGGRFHGLSPHVGRVAVSGLVLSSLFLVGVLNSDFEGGLLFSSALLLIYGVLVAAIFAHAASGSSAQQRRLVSLLYSADLVGGCIGSVVASLFLIPVLGLGGTAMVLALAAFLALPL